MSVVSIIVSSVHVLGLDVTNALIIAITLANSRTYRLYLELSSCRVELVLRCHAGTLKEATVPSISLEDENCELSNSSSSTSTNVA